MKFKGLFQFKSMASPQFPFYAQDFLTGCVYMTNEEVGMYIKMLCKQWTDGSIPKKRLGLLVGYEWDNFSDELKSKFEDKGDCLINKRLESERNKKVKFLEKQAINGKKGGRPPKTAKNPGLSFGLTQKKPLDNDNDNYLNKKDNEINDLFKKFVEEVKKGEHTQAVEQLYMRLKIRDGTLTDLIKEFNGHLIVENTLHKNTLEFRKHFSNWLNKLNEVGKLDQYKKTKKIGSL